MKRIALLFALFAVVPSFASPKALRHCQIPCGIYGDQARVAMILEDAATIEKGMKMIGELEAEGKDSNQLVRWVMNKDQHAAAIQETVASYWLAQRIKAPQETDGEAARLKYWKQLEQMHGLTVAAMKCKQTTDAVHVASIRKGIMAFSESYFSEEDMKHLRDHHEKGH